MVLGPRLPVDRLEQITTWLGDADLTAEAAERVHLEAAGEDVVPGYGQVPSVWI